MIFDTSEFTSQKAIHDYLHKNVDKVLYAKKSDRKNADEIGCFFSPAIAEGSALKAIVNTIIEDAPDVLPVKVAINTTNLYDSHQDVHIDNIWKKALKENRFIQHLREHQGGFANVISDSEDLKAYTETMSFRDLGFKYEGSTQALIFDSKIKKNRNPFMHEQYANGWVKQHSVGMYYVNVIMAIDNKDYPEEFRAWKKYIDRIGNKDDIKDGFFFPVLEAKIIEGSAVTRGSNHVTPTLSNNDTPKEPSNTGHSATKDEPPTGTHTEGIPDYLLY